MCGADFARRLRAGCLVATALVSIASGTGAKAAAPTTVPTGSFEVLSRRPGDGSASAVEVRVTDDADNASPLALPVRVIVTASDGSHPDGSGHGAYADGRFFADGQFSVAAPSGALKISLLSGPDYVPLEMETTVERGQVVLLHARLHRWFSPAKLGWYCGDNHVHLRHDPTSAVRSTPAYAALQGRADGLNWISEADGATPAEELAKLDGPDFLFRVAAEQRPGPYVGHLNTPGIARPITIDEAASWSHQPLPVQAMLPTVHKLGGVVIYTHPLTPTHLRHWMGATEAISDAVLGECADLFDLDSAQTQTLWFALLNLGNRLSCSSYTDCVLGRRETLSPGDRRVYVHAAKFDYPSIIAGLQAGHTFATNGGPIFPFLTIGGGEPGDLVSGRVGQPLQLHATLHALYPLTKAVLFDGGRVSHQFDVAGRSGEVRLETSIARIGVTDSPWFVLRVEDDRGNWAVTSPVYPMVSKPKSNAMVTLEIANHTRFAELRLEYFAHLIATVSPDDPLLSVELLRDGKVIQVFIPVDGDSLPSGTMPTTQLGSAYTRGWAWARRYDKVVHLQADRPVSDGGWYSCRLHTESGRTVGTNELFFDATNPNSQAISSARISGNRTRFLLNGYGEDLSLADLHPPYHGDHWWYTRRTYWKLDADFDGQVERLDAGDSAIASKFR